MDAFSLDLIHATSVAQVERVCGGNLADRVFNQPNEFLILRNTRNIRLGIIERQQLRRNERRQVYRAAFQSSVL